MPFANGMHYVINNVVKSSTLGQYRRIIYNFSKDSSAPMHFNFGKRMLNIIYTKLRHNCILNYDLYRKNIADTPNCSCAKQEDAYNFFFVKLLKCKVYHVRQAICSSGVITGRQKAVGYMIHV